ASSVFGQAVSFTAVVTISGPGAGKPAGNVIFTIDRTAQAPVGLSGSSAVLSTSSLAVGPHTIHASYGGDGNFVGSTSSEVMLTVNPPTVTPAADLRVTVSPAAPNPVLPGQPYRYTITVSNIGTLKATNVVLVDAVARGVKPLTVNSARVIGKTFGIQSPGFLMRLSSLRAGTNATLTVSESAGPSGRF